MLVSYLFSSTNSDIKLYVFMGRADKKRPNFRNILRNSAESQSGGYLQEAGFGELF